MYHIIKKYRKRLLAVAGAFLMVAFLLPTSNLGGGSDPVIGRVYGEKVRYSELQRSQYNWSQLTRGILLQDQRPMAAMLGDEIAMQIHENPELFLLLIKEARNRGIYISEDVLRDQMEQLLLPGFNMRNPQEAQLARGAVRDLMLVQESFRQTMSAIRVSEPMRQRELAALLQEMRLKAVDFPASEFAQKIEAPTVEDLQKHFDQYKDRLPVPPARAPRDNPFGYGYRFPDRAAIQYISLPADAVRKVVEASRTPERWRIDARRHYLQNQQAYQTTTQPAGTTQPVATTRPFEEVSEQALDAVIYPEVEKLQNAIASRISSILAGDWGSFRAASAASAAPANAADAADAADAAPPKSSLGPVYNSFEYFQALAEAIQKEFGVRPTIGASGEVIAEAEMQQLGPIARSRTTAGIPFSAYAIMTETQRRELISRIPTLPPTLDLFQPSQILRDFEGDLFVFRRTAFDPAHEPKDLAEVRERVEQDLRRLRMFEAAKAAAEQFTEAARTTGFEEAARNQGRQIIETGFIPSPDGIVMGLHLTDAAGPLFTSRAVDALLTRRAEGEERPVAAVPVEPDARVIVARMEELRSNYQPALAPLYTSMVDRRLMTEMARPIVDEWFDYESVAKRVSFEPAERRAAPEGPSAPTPPMGPIRL